MDRRRFLPLVILWSLLYHTSAGSTITGVATAEEDKILTAWRCSGEYFFDGLQCKTGRVIHVVNASYGEDDQKHRCVGPGTRDCRIPIEIYNLGYYKDILIKCNGRTRCVGLYSKSIRHPCAPFGTDYVIIHYTCQTARTVGPQANGLFPRYGPLAGGTILTVIGANLGGLSKFQVGPHDCSIIHRNMTEILAETPKVARSALGNHMLVKLNFGSVGIVLKAPDTFEYRPNPRVIDIEPLEVIYKGGVIQTVNGSSLDAVSEPRLEITMTRAGQQTSVTGECHVNTSEKMTCITPEIRLDPEVRASLQRQNKTAARGRDPVVPLADFRVGVKLDGVTAYQNFLPLQVIATYPVMFELEPDIYKFNSPEHTVIHLKGKDLTAGIQLGDYEVSLGDDYCDVIQVSTSTLTCRPPAEKPRQLNEASPGLELSVSAGRKLKYRLGFVRYTSRRMVIVRAVAVVIAISAVLVVGAAGGIYWKRKRKEHQQEFLRTKFKGDPDEDMILKRVSDIYPAEASGTQNTAEALCGVVPVAAMVACIEEGTKDHTKSKRQALASRGARGARGGEGRQAGAALVVPPATAPRTAATGTGTGPTHAYLTLVTDGEVNARDPHRPPSVRTPSDRDDGYLLPSGK